jgi:hypothetical protein
MVDKDDGMISCEIRAFDNNNVLYLAAACRNVSQSLNDFSLEMKSKF